VVDKKAWAMMVVKQSRGLANVLIRANDIHNIKISIRAWGMVVVKQSRGLTNMLCHDMGR